MSNIMSAQDALIATMVLTSAADRDMSKDEFKAISAIVGRLPAFIGYDRDRITLVAETVVDVVQSDEGLDTIIGMIEDALPHRLRETAYALACDVAAADGRVTQEEARLLEILRHRLEVGRLPAAAIERAARARHQPAEAEGD